MSEGPLSVKNIWAFPTDGQVSDLSPILNASSLKEAFIRSESHRENAITGMEQQTEQILVEAREMQKQLKAQGFDFDVDRMMKPGITERMMMALDDARDWVGEKLAGQSDQGLEDAGSFSIPLGMTHPTDSLSHEYDDMFAETKRFRQTIAAQIIAARNQQPQTITVPQSVLDTLFEDDDSQADGWNEEGDLLLELENYCAYWPPKDGRPALAISERQEDGGLPIEIDLVFLATADHRKTTEIMKKYGIM